MCTRKTACVSVSAVMAAAGSASGQVLFTDDFTGGPKSAWGNERGAWTVANGEYFATQPGNSPPTYTSLPLTVRDMDLELDAVAIGDGGIWVHINAAGDHGLLLVMGGNVGTYPGFYWHRITNGSYAAPEGHSGQVFNFGDTVHVRVRARDDVYEVFVGSSTTPVSTLVTGQFPTGRVGLYDFTSGGLRFDNVELSVPCRADYNLDGTLDAFDYDDFVSAYFDYVNNGNGFPDYNVDGTVDAFDYDDFVSEFFTGCE